jgi:VWFA-related protein
MNVISKLRPQSTRPSARAGSRSLWATTLRLIWYALAISLLATFASVPAYAQEGEGSVTLRVEARPIADPINVFVTVTNGDGAPVGALTAADFTVLVDGIEVISPTFALSPIQDEEQQASIVFVMDYSTSTSEAQPAMEQAVLTFLQTMEIGDYGALIKFNETNEQRVAVLQPFTMIDGASGSSALAGAVTTPFQGMGSPVIDALEVAVGLFVSPETPPLPAGPWVVILVSDGGDNTSDSTGRVVVDAANAAGVSIFTVGVGVLEQNVRGREITGRQLLQELTFQTGGQYYEAPDDQAIEEAYGTIATLLQNEYMLTFGSNITDCNEHTIEVRVTDQVPATSTFTRCTAPDSTTPPPTGDVGGTPLPPPDDNGGTGGSSGGGGGSVGVLELIAGVSLLALRRRFRKI